VQIVGEVADIELGREGRTVLRLDSGKEIVADRVVLALGNYAPADPPMADGGAALATARYIRDPWRPGALEVASPHAPVLLVGTGLTMIDVALDLRSRGRTAPMHAVSRRGLLPQPHRQSGVPPTFEHRPPQIETGPATVRHYLRAVRAHVRHVAPNGVDWRDVVTALRPITSTLWRRLDTRERARFLRHLRPFWEAHRHRSAPRPAALLARMIAEGDLTVHAARLVALRAAPDSIEVVLRRRGQASEERLVVGAVVNCTGPQSDLRHLDDRLVKALRARGLIRADPLGLGLEVADDGAVLDAGRRPSRVLYHVGPLLRARDWEATAVPELRSYAAATAATLIGSLVLERRVRGGTSTDPTRIPPGATARRVDAELQVRRMQG